MFLHSNHFEIARGKVSCFSSFLGIVQLTVVVRISSYNFGVKSYLVLQKQDSGYLWNETAIPQIFSARIAAKTGVKQNQN